jgi:hypothetical protein
MEQSSSLAGNGYPSPFAPNPATLDEIEATPRLKN